MIWKAVVDDIINSLGLSDAEIAKQVGVTKEAIRKLRRGLTAEPRYSTGTRLLVLHSSACPEYYSTCNNEVVQITNKHDEHFKRLQHYRSYLIS